MKSPMKTLKSLIFLKGMLENVCPFRQHISFPNYILFLFTLEKLAFSEATSVNENGLKELSQVLKVSVSRLNQQCGPLRCVWLVR